MFFNADDSIILFVKEKIIQNVSEAAKNQRIAVGVSGGVDSMVLLRALIEAKKSTDFSFFIVNIDSVVPMEDTGVEDFAAEEEYSVCSVEGPATPSVYRLLYFFWNALTAYSVAPS